MNKVKLRHAPSSGQKTYCPLILFGKEKEILGIAENCNSGQANPENKGEGLAFIRFQKETGQGCFEEKFIGKQELQVVEVSPWLQGVVSVVAKGREIFLAFF